MTFGAVGFSLLSQLFGEVVGQGATSQTMMSAYLAVCVLLVRKGTKRLTSRNCVSALTLASFSSAVWIFVINFDERTSINFLGFGYDNVGHLMQGRLLMENGGSLLLSGGSKLGPTFLQDATQITGSLIASLAQLTGNKSSNIPGVLAVLVIITLAIPILTVLAPVLGFITKPHKRFEPILILMASTTLFLTGYLSRIWFSGYLGSNLGSLCLVLIAIHIVVSKNSNVALLLIAFSLTVHVYPVFFIFGLPLGLAFALSIRGPNKRNFNFSAFSHSMQSLLAVVFCLLLYLPIKATSRSYGSSQFFVDGGIEPFPLSYFTLLALLFLVPLALTSLFDNIASVGCALLIGCLIGGVSLVVYSFSRVDGLTYYPTKVIISTLLIIFSVSLVLVAPVISSTFRVSLFFIIFYMVATYALFQPNSTIFVTAFMGEVPTVISSALNEDSGVVDPNRVSNLRVESQRSDLPILYISDSNESELNTRWVNVLSFHWTDETWGLWTEVRTLISNQTYAQMEGLMGKILIATDQLQLFETLFSLYPG